MCTFSMRIDPYHLAKKDCDGWTDGQKSPNDCSNPPPMVLQQGLIFWNHELYTNICTYTLTYTYHKYTDSEINDNLTVTTALFQSSQGINSMSSGMFKN